MVEVVEDRHDTRQTQSPRKGKSQLLDYSTAVRQSFSTSPIRSETPHRGVISGIGFWFRPGDLEIFGALAAVAFTIVLS
jgi:hypothetical protein